jgi:hypothetical protein
MSTASAMAVVGFGREQFPAALQRLFLKGFAHDDVEVIGVKRLGDEIISAFFHRRHCAVDGTMGRNDHDGKSPPNTPQVAQHLDAAHLRHLQVQQHQSRLMLLDLDQRFLAVGGQRDLASQRPQTHLQQPTRRRVVVDDQHARSRRHPIGLQG